MKNKEKESDGIMAIPSINTILPYEIPAFLKSASLGALYELSQVCMENARDIYKVLEKEYRRQYGRQLTLDRIGEVASEPRYPDSIGLNRDRLQQAPSQILEEELKKLRRLSILVKKDMGSKNRQ